MVIGIDFGFGHIKYACSNKDNEIEVGKISSIVAVDNKNMGNMGNDTLHYNGANYSIGEMAFYHDNKSDIEHYSDLEKYAPLFLYSVLKKLNTKSEDIESLVICLSPAHYQHKNDFLKTIKNFTINGETCSFEKIIVLQQGACAKDVIEKKREKNDKSKDYLIVDIGFNTLDVCVVLDGKIQETRLQGDSVESYGVIQMANRVLAEAKSRMKTERIGIKDAMNIIITKGMLFRGEQYDFSELVEQEKEGYFKIIKSFLEKNYQTLIDRLEVIYLIGGGSYYVEPYEKHFKKFDENADYFNALGCLFEAQKQGKKK